MHYISLNPTLTFLFGKVFYLLISLILPFKFLTLMNAASFIASRFLWCFCIYYYTVFKGSSIFVWRHYYILHNCRFFIPGEAWLFLYHFIWYALIFISAKLYQNYTVSYKVRPVQVHVYKENVHFWKTRKRDGGQILAYIYIFVCFILNATYSCL